MIDTYGRNIHYLRLSVTDRCNLRCRYCMPAEGVCKKRHDEMLTEEEMIAAVRAAASLGIDKLRLTGGEPLVKQNILSLCEKSAAVPGIREVCLTTNGTLLPTLAKPLRAAGVQRLNISLDTLNAEKYAYITRVGTLDAALRGMEAALDAGFSHLKINAVLIGGFNDDEIPALAGLTRRYPTDVRFIELMPMTENEAFGARAYVSGDAVLQALPELAETEQDDGVAKLYRSGGMKKGDVLTVAQIAGVMGAKRTPDIIPMCHPILLDGIDLSLRLDESRCSVEIEAAVSCDGRTGVEMEALTAASTAALTVYDMCKAVQKDMVISDIRLLRKSGGVHGNFERKEE